MSKSDTAHSSNDELRPQERLIEACKSGNLEDVKQAITSGAVAPDAQNEDRHLHVKEGDKALSPLGIAVENNNIEVVKYLIEKLHISPLYARIDVDYDGESLLRHAAINNYFEIAQILLSHEDVWADHNDFLLSKDEQNDTGDSPLQQAASKGHLEMVNLLLDNGADIDIIYNDEDWDDAVSTPLYKALSNNHFEVANLLLQNGANPFPDLSDQVQYENYDDETTPFNEFCKEFNVNVESNGTNQNTKTMAKILLKLEAHGNFKPEDHSGKIEECRENINSALQEVDVLEECVNGDVAVLKYLIEQRGGITKINTQRIEGRQEELKNLVPDGKDFGDIKVAEATPLSTAAFGKNVDVVEFLTSLEGEDPNIIVSHGSYSILGFVATLAKEKLDLANDATQQLEKSADESQNKELSAYKDEYTQDMRDFLKIADLLVAKGASLNDDIKIKFDSISYAKSEEEVRKSLEEKDSTPLLILNNLLAEITEEFPNLKNAMSTESKKNLEDQHSSKKRKIDGKEFSPTEQNPGTSPSESEASSSQKGNSKSR
jgi:ankyrin repeat protein